MKISLPESYKSSEGPSSSPILTNRVLENRKNLNSESLAVDNRKILNSGSLRDLGLRTPNHLETIREMRDKEGNTINVHIGIDDSPTGLSQFVDGRYEEVRANDVDQEEFNRFLSSLTPSRNDNDSRFLSQFTPSRSNIEDPMRSSWLLQQP